MKAGGGGGVALDPEEVTRPAHIPQDGLSVRFGLVQPRADLDVLMIAPKGPGTALRSLYTEGKGMIAVWAQLIPQL